ncbi:sensor histidine kinase [Thermithiobacillus plumbiphilus]|uniref:histidine kinase n=1 Tax=Thermithiobacillus plumbiphilus TaxID=1729899 RepID=A0ABU9DCF3_9PROT
MPRFAFHHLNLRTKSAIYVLLLVVVIFATISAVLYTSVHREMLNQLGDDNMRMTRTFAASAANAVLLKDLSDLTDQVEQLRKNPSVRAAEIVDTRGIIVASTDISRLGLIHPEASAILRAYQRTRNPVVLETDRPCCPVRGNLHTPIMVRSDVLGLAFLHLDDAQLTSVVSHRLDTTVQRLVLLGALATLLGLIGAFVVSGFVTRPILRLAEEVEGMKTRLKLLPDGENPEPNRHGDEIVRLEAGFHQLERQLNQYLQQLDQLNKKQQAVQCLATIGEMSAQVAHEIRNALSSLRGAARYLARYGHLGDKQEFVGIIEEEVQRLYKMTEGFLDFGRPYKLNPEPVSVCDLIRRSVQRHTCEIEQKQLKVGYHCPEGYTLNLDSSLIEQALSNLLLNAIDALHNGGRIEISAIPEGNEGVALSVRDNGPGIDPARAQEIFKPYITTKAKGNGLGLAVVAKVAMVHDGLVELKPNTEGAHFVMHLHSVKPAGNQYHAAANSNRGG